VDALEGAYAAELLPAPVRGTGYGVLSTVNGVGDFVSSVLVGVLWSRVSASAGFGYAAAAGFAGALTLILLRGERS
jgi:fluoride ion exporter CrcB/FEX